MKTPFTSRPRRGPKVEAYPAHSGLACFLLRSRTDAKLGDSEAMRLLLIEDHVPVAEVLTEALSDIGHQVSVAHTGEEGLRELVSNPPDAVFLDVTLPGMDGITVLRAIRERDPQLPVIILSGHVTLEQIEQLRSLGIHDVIQKPETLSRLTDVLAVLSSPSG